MFYAQFVLAKKGPLSKIWLAAHWERKLSKAQIFETDVQDAVNEIMQPSSKMSLRTTGHLLLGVVRIYSKKAKYVLADCNEAFIKIKMSFRPGTTELQALEKKDRPENDLLEDLDMMVPDLADYDFAPGSLQLTQSRIDDITLQEDNFDTRSFREQSFADDMDDFGDCDSNFDEEFERTRRNFELLQKSGNGSEAEIQRRSVSYMDEGTGSDGALNMPDDDDFGVNDDELEDLENILNEHVDDNQMNSDNLVLEPLSETQLQNEKSGPGRPKRKRKLLIDDSTTISGEEMKTNMSDYIDTLQPLDLAPPTKRLMRLKETSTADRILNAPATDLFNNERFLDLYRSHMIAYIRPDDGKTAEEVRRELSMLDTIDDDYENEDPNQPEFAFDSLLDDDFGGNGDDLDETPTEDVLENGKEETKKRRRQDKHDEEEEDGEQNEEEEAVFSKRTLGVLNAIAHRLKINDDKIELGDLLTKSATHKSAAQKFYALLELHKSQAIHVEQKNPFGPIVIQPGPQLNEYTSTRR